jgi:hypothetical protein
MSKDVFTIIQKLEAFLSRPATNAYLLVAALLLFLSFFRLETVPPLWWDEGWTLQVARNWIEIDHYGRLKLAEPISARLTGSFIVVAPVALSFELFGIGIWQGRLPGVILTLLALGLMVFIASRLYKPKIAGATLFVLMLMPATNELHALYLGRQVLGEMPALFYILAGYLFLYLSLRRSAWWAILAVIFLGIAFRSKAQVPPFLLVSLLFPILIALMKRWWRTALLLCLVLIGSWSAYHGLLYLQGMILSGRTVPGEAIPGIYGISAFIPHWSVRKVNLFFAFTLGLPSMLGLIYVVKQSFQALFRSKTIVDIPQEILRLILIGFAASWFAWYILMAGVWGRYIFPVVFVSSVFVAAWLYQLTSAYDLRFVVKNSSDVLLLRHLNKTSFGALFSLLVIIITVPLSIYTMVESIVIPQPPAALEVASFLDQHLSSQDIIESYESELFFLSDRKFHFPPDRISVELMVRAMLDPTAVVDYDPLVANPDYLIVGPFNRVLPLYDEIISSHEFRLIEEIPPYRIFARVR